MKTIHGNVWVIQLKVIGVIAVIRDTKSGEWYWFRRWATEYGRFYLGVQTSFAESAEQKFKIVHQDWDGKGRAGLDNFIAWVCRLEVPEGVAFSFARDEPPPVPKRQRLTCETHQATTRYYYRHELCDACGQCAACGWTKAELEVKATSGSDLYWGCRGERWKEFETRWKVSTDAAESFAALNAALCESKKAIEALAAAPDGLAPGGPQRPTIHRTLAEFHAMPRDELDKAIEELRADRQKWRDQVNQISNKRCANPVSAWEFDLDLQHAATMYRRAERALGDAIRSVGVYEHCQNAKLARANDETQPWPLDELKREWQNASEEALAARRDINRLGSSVNQDQKDYYNEKLRGAIDAGNRYLCALRVALGNDDTREQWTFVTNPNSDQPVWIERDRDFGGPIPEELQKTTAEYVWVAVPPGGCRPEGSIEKAGPDGTMGYFMRVNPMKPVKPNA